MDTPKNLNSNDTLADVAGRDTSPRHDSEYKEFIGWIALPIKERQPQTQKELAEQFGLSEWTLSTWKSRSGFWQEVEKLRKEWGKNKTPEVLDGLFERAKTGDPAAARLWLEVMENHSIRNKTDITTVNANIDLAKMLDDIQNGEQDIITPNLNDSPTGDHLMRDSS